MSCSRERYAGQDDSAVAAAAAVLQQRQKIAAAHVASSLQQLCTFVEPSSLANLPEGSLQSLCRCLQAPPCTNATAEWLQYTHELQQQMLQPRSCSLMAELNERSMAVVGAHSRLEGGAYLKRPAQAALQSLDAALSLGMMTSCRNAVAALHIYIQSAVAAQQRIMASSQTMRASCFVSTAATQGRHCSGSLLRHAESSSEAVWSPSRDICCQGEDRHLGSPLASAPAMGVLAWPQPRKPLCIPLSAHHLKGNKLAASEADVLCSLLVPFSAHYEPADNSSDSLRSAGKLDLSLEHLISLKGAMGDAMLLTRLVASNNMLTDLTGELCPYCIGKLPSAA